MIKRTFFLVLSVIIVLVGMYFLPQITVAGYKLRQVNILADVMADQTNAPATTTTATEKAKEETIITDYKDSVPEGMIPIEDFHDSLGINREMDKFFEALRHTKKRIVRIAYLGDSFVEGDILTATLRELLQQKYGGKGVGFVDIQSQIAGFRTTVLSFSRGWTEYSAINSVGKGFNSKLQGINGRYYIPTAEANIDIRGQHRVYATHLDTVQTATVFFTPTQNLSMDYSINDEEYKPLYTMEDDSTACDKVDTCSIKGKIGKVSIKVAGNGRFYGIALENKTGIILDNFAMRGSIGWHLGQIPTEVIQQFAKVRHYDLIIMHFGLNMAAPTTHNYTAFCEKFKKGINNFRKAYPKASFLIVSMSNRDVRTERGDFQTMEGVEDLVEAQRDMAKDEGIAFWNLQQGMGGSGSMARLQKQGKANRDYTHINFRGGEEIGKTFYNVLMNGKMNYDMRKGYITNKQPHGGTNRTNGKPSPNPMPETPTIK